MVNPIRPKSVSDSKETRKGMDRAEIKDLADLLRTGNLYEAKIKLAGRITPGDFEDFMRSRCEKYYSEVLQTGEVKSFYAEGTEPNVNQFLVQHPEAKMSKEESEYLRKSLGDAMDSFSRGGSGAKSKSLAVKAAVTPDSGGSATETPTSKEEAEAMAKKTLDEWDQFMSDTMNQVIDAQFMTDYKARMGEVQQEVQRIISLVRSGAIGAEFALIAMAKVNAAKNGVLMTWLGKKAFNVNESMSKIANDLNLLDPSANNPQYMAELQLGQSKTRDGAFQLQLLTTDLQKVMQDVSGVLEQVQTMISEINRTKREMTANLNLR